MKNFSKRQYQIGELIKRTLSNLFLEGIFENKVTSLFSITEVSPSPGFQSAWVFISVMDKSKESEIIKQLNDMTNEIRFVLANKINLKNTPSLIFKIDNSLDYANKIEKLLNSPDVQKDLK